MSSPKSLSPHSRTSKPAARLNLFRLSTIGLGLFSLGLGWLLAANFYERNRIHRLTLAAGSAQGESFILGRAIETVVERHYPKIDITVRETGGTSENLKQLEANQAQLAAAQADVPPGNSARTVAKLYVDKFQLLTHAKSGIQRFPDLRGKRIALPTKGGQYRSFLDVAAHFGLAPQDFTFVGETEEAANEAFLRNQADAAFRVRAMGNPSILKLVQTGQVQFMPIEQAAAMKIKYPAFEPAMIPQGAYRGNLPLPAQDLPTVAVQRLLLARSDVNKDVVQAITSVLMEHRQEIAAAIPDEFADVRPLAANIAKSDTENGLSAPIHEGTTAYYDRDKPSFLQENADFLALILTVSLLLGSWLWQLKRFLEQRQKNNADDYTKQAITLMQRAPALATVAETEAAQHSLLSILTKAVDALDQDHISEESFQSFRVVWQIAIDVIKERRQILLQNQQKTPASHPAALSNQ